MQPPLSFCAFCASLWPNKPILRTSYLEFHPQILLFSFANVTSGFLRENSDNSKWVVYKTPPLIYLSMVVHGPAFATTASAHLGYWCVRREWPFSAPRVEERERPTSAVRGRRGG